MVGGYVGQILRISLTNNNIDKIPLDYSLARKFLGGRGLAAKILFDEISPKTTPLNPDNKLIIGTGPVTGCLAPAANRIVVVTKSPETNLFLDTYAGGNFAPEMKFAGYDFIIVEGRAEKPVYIQIDDAEVVIKDASKFWGKDCWESESILKEELGDESARAMVIGPAGENLVKFAVISTDYYHQCGRGGAGAVMGSKNLKGIVVRGTGDIKVAAPSKLKDFMLSKIEWFFTEGPSSLSVKDRIKFGTPLTMVFTQMRGILPTKNFQSGQFDSFEKIDCHTMRNNFVLYDKSCYACNTPCGKYSYVKKGPYEGAAILGPEYETLSLLGSNLRNDSLEAIIQANIVCDRLGVDTISCGNIIGFVMECYEKRIITKKDIDGLELKFGNMDAAIELIHKISHRKGIGDILADGVKVAAEKINKGAEKYAMHVKGLEYPAYDPRASPAFALLYAITDRGACHRRGWPVIIEDKVCKPFVIEGRPKLVKELIDIRIPLHCGVVCDFPYNVGGIKTDEYATIVSTITGWDITTNELRILSDRVASLIRAFNIREGASRSDDILAWRSMSEPLPDGPGKGHYITKQMLDSMLEEYYDLRGWDKSTGIPTYETLEELGLSDVAKELASYGHFKPKEIKQ